MTGVVVGADGVARCWWAAEPEVYRAYHDTEWGRPVHDDRLLYEKLCLEGFQAGLSWLVILRKRSAFRAAFADFEPEAVAGFDDRDVERLLEDPGIVRHRGKIEAAIHNARVVLELAADHGSFDAFVWSFAPAESPAPTSRHDIPVTTPEAHALAKALKARGARFFGPTTAYAFMQALGLVDDHLVGCAVRDSLG